jgi:pimeloyl-ACP methyl ester carboxylesterase
MPADRSALAAVERLCAQRQSPERIMAEPFASRRLAVDGIHLHVRSGGSGPPVLLLHGFGETGAMWDPALPLLARGHTVIVPDLRGAGGSDKPEGGYDKASMARDMHALVRRLGLDGAAAGITVVGHDIGLMVAYAYAAQFPQETARVVLMDAFLPGIGNWKAMWLLRDLWHFHFYGPTPLALVTGRERIYLEHFWNDFAFDAQRSLPQADRERYAAAYAQPGAMRAAMDYFRNFERDAADFTAFARTPLKMPVRIIAGEKSGGNFLIEQVRLVAEDVEGTVVPGSGHWLLEEAPDRVIPLLQAYIG